MKIREMIKDINSFNEAKNELLKKIDKAFDGITLGNGIGPNEAWAIDDCLDKKNDDYKKRFDLDERYDRRNVVDYFDFIYSGNEPSNCKDLPIDYDHRGVFSNDAESRKFLLPSYISEAIKKMNYKNIPEFEETFFGDFFSITEPNDTPYGKIYLNTYKKLFSLLTQPQKEVILEFLNFQLENLGEKYKEKIKRNIEVIKKYI